MFIKKNPIIFRVIHSMNTLTGTTLFLKCFTSVLGRFSAAVLCYSKRQLFMMCKNVERGSG